MRVGQVAYVNIVAQAGAVGGRIVLPEYPERRPARGGIDGQRNQMKFRVVILADGAVGMRPGRVEVPQRHPPQPKRAFEVRQRPFDGELGLAIRIDRPLIERLDDGNGDGFAVHRACGREHEAAHARVAHRFEHRQCADDVVAVVLERPLHRLAHGEPGGKVHDRVGTMILQRAAHGGHVMDPRPHQRNARRHGLRVPRGQIVNDGHRVAGVHQRAHRVAADVSRAAGDDYARHVSVRSSSR